MQGMIDFDLRDNIREMQAKFGMTPDGNPTWSFWGGWWGGSDIASYNGPSNI